MGESEIVISFSGFLVLLAWYYLHKISAKFEGIEKVLQKLQKDGLTINLNKKEESK